VERVDEFLFARREGGEARPGDRGEPGFEEPNHLRRERAAFFVGERVNLLVHPGGSRTDVGLVLKAATQVMTVPGPVWEGDCGAECRSRPVYPWRDARTERGSRTDLARSPAVVIGSRCQPTKKASSRGLSVVGAAGIEPATPRV
jgi:hypothetical protein